MMLLFYFKIYIRLSQIIGRGIVNNLSVLAKARAVAGAVPAVLRFVVFQCAPKVRTARSRWGQKPLY